MEFPFLTAISSWFGKRVFNRLFDSRRDQFQRRRDLFQAIMGQRSAIYEGANGEGQNGHPFLGQACVVFAGCRPVADALRKLHEQRDSPERVRDNLLTLFKEMAKETGMPLDAYNDDFLLRPVSTEWSGSGE